mmetsp:Transcript_47651/g.113428  ORF Transcript_47651/g.113428 Transcript_47651/m.113428 type:complete len:230 (+) Transcript_47651:1151-1840(+)
MQQAAADDARLAPPSLHALPGCVHPGGGPFGGVPRYWAGPPEGGRGAGVAGPAVVQVLQVCEQRAAGLCREGLRAALLLHGHPHPGTRDAAQDPGPVPRRPPHRPVDAGANEVRGDVQARGHVLLSRLSSLVGGLHLAETERRLCRRRRPPLQVVHPPRLRPPRPPSRTHTVGDSLARAGRRFLLVRQERDFRAGRDPAEALLLNHLPRRSQLRRDRDDSGARNDARLR